MTRLLVVLMTVLMTLSCSSREIIPVPEAVPIPDGWYTFSRDTFGNSQCPQIAGTYVEPPDRYSTPGSQFEKINYLRFGYAVILPFHLTEKLKPTESQSIVTAGELTFFQEEESRFRFRDTNLKSEISEYIFQQAEGHYECLDGMMYFPLITRYGANQQGNFNDQHQRILAVDSRGNLILIRISGPYKKTFLNRKAHFEYDYMRYKKTDLAQ